MEWISADNLDINPPFKKHLLLLYDEFRHKHFAIGMLEKIEITEDKRLLIFRSNASKDIKETLQVTHWCVIDEPKVI